MQKYLFLLICWLLLSCNKEQKEEFPEYLLSEKVMIDVLVDVHLIDALIEEERIPKDSVKIYAKTYYDDIYKAHKLDASDFHKSYQYYLERPEKMDQLYLKLIEEMSIREAELKK